MGYYQQLSDRSCPAGVQHPAPSDFAAFFGLDGVAGCEGRAVSLDLADEAP